MKKRIKLSSFLSTAAFLFVFGFVIRLGADYFQYQEGMKPYPFYYYIIGRGVTFLVPGIVFSIGGKWVNYRVLKCKNK